jgi:Tol biopolymer transport system component
VRPGSPIFAIGEDRLGELQRLDTQTLQSASMLDGASAEGVRYSPDGRQLLYLSYPQGQLWVRRADGTRPVQLTSPPLVVSYAHWSHDGSRIAFVGHESRRGAGSIYVIDSLGGAPQRVRTVEDSSFGDPAWLPDGRLVFGLLGTSGRRDLAYLHVADVKTGAVARLPGSEGLFSPRCCSARGDLAALQWRSDSGPRELVVFNWKEGKRVSHLPGVRARFPEWAPDGAWLAFLEDDRLMRWQPGQPAAQRWLDVPIGEFGGFYHSFTFAPDGSLLRALNHDRQQVYSLQIPARLR